MQKIKFSALNIGDKFLCNGNLCEKKSTRTALLIEFGRVFYFGLNELVIKK
jgi:hypothetical protein